MPTRRLLLASLLAGAAFLVAAAPSVSSGAEGRIPLAVVVSKHFPVDDLSFGDLKRLYLGDPVNAGGRKLIPLALAKHSPERVSFDRTVLGMSPDEAAAYWIDRKIRGQSGPPKAIDSGDVLVRVVSRVDGAIGYVRPNTVGHDVKVLRIDGKGPNDPGYRVNF